MVAKSPLHRLLLLVASVYLINLSQALRQRVPQNNKVEEGELRPRALLRDLRYNDCPWYPEYQAEFCCSDPKECDTELEWFIEDQEAILDRAKDKQ